MKMKFKLIEKKGCQGFNWINVLCLSLF